MAKTKFSQLNDEKFYFSDGVVFLPFGHKNLKQIDDFKKRSKNREIFLGRKRSFI